MDRREPDLHQETSDKVIEGLALRHSNGDVREQ
jgi:hypothetical protein